MIKRDIFIYKDSMVDLNKVVAIDFDDDTIIFSMDGDWEYEIDIEKIDIEVTKKTLVSRFTGY